MQLRSTKKGSKTMSEFLLSIKKIADELYTISVGISTHELLESIFDD
ncbi:Retrovirus-related Pol polyprotein from transposon TNT 1-94 [Senna tora]|uniref:Retrovirus-related Pol polyprotein from transposon TNT 1-94 n=1 Tax=Senna tora TaxID=362788 RepID=A0A834WDE5_9FABA|nr:Retrovirus-related Pol polyprotein from transposon TNT 1-94 [Senna tora]